MASMVTPGSTLLSLAVRAVPAMFPLVVCAHSDGAAIKMTTTTPAIESDLGISRSFELLEDHCVHARAGVDESGGHDGQRAPIFSVPCRAEEAPRLLHGPRVDAARENLSRSSLLVVVGA